MQSGIDAGELRDDLAPEDLTRGFLALQNGLLYLWLADPRTFHLADSAQAAARIFVRGVRRE
jgi:hypothetical protein